MILSALALSLAAVASGPARVEALANGQFRISLSREGLDSGIFVRAILDIRADAARRCQGHGDPVEIGRGGISLLPNNRWEMVSTFACATRLPPSSAPTEADT